MSKVFTRTVKAIKVAYSLDNGKQTEIVLEMKNKKPEIFKALSEMNPDAQAIAVYSVEDASRKYTIDLDTLISNANG